MSELEQSEPVEQAQDSPQKTWLLIGGSVVLAVICLIGLGSPDSNKLERDFRGDLKPGAQVKDVIAYIKDHGWTYDWNQNEKSLTIVVPGAAWLPIIKPRYRKSFYFDHFNRLKGQNGNIEYGL
ncbi:MAG TPA: hypothetical protein V6C86_22855 [Oculatellaceae cyanobacterium]